MCRDYLFKSKFQHRNSTFTHNLKQNQFCLSDALKGVKIFELWKFKANVYLSIIPAFLNNTVNLRILSTSMLVNRQ